MAMGLPNPAMRKPESSDDRHVIAKHSEIYPSVKLHLKKISEHFSLLHNLFTRLVLAIGRGVGSHSNDGVVCGTCS